MSNELADAVFEAIGAVTEPLHARIKALELTIAELKAMPRFEVPGPPGPAGDRGVDGKDGEIGPPGPQGAPGTDGWTGPTGERGEKGIAGDVGLMGAEGIPGRDGLPGVSGPAGLQGKDGVNGLHGKDGADGLGFDDMRVDYDGERTFSLVFERGEQVKTFPFTVPFVLDRGVFSAGKTYQPGDGVTWGGSFYVAQQETSAKPGESSADSRAWRLTVKRGGDGKTGVPGPVGPSGPRGESGPQGKAGY